jgi:hypothetical protein
MERVCRLGSGGHTAKLAATAGKQRPGQAPAAQTAADQGGDRAERHLA